MGEGSGPIRVGIVGAGTNARAKHIPGLQAIEGVEVVSVVNRSRASSERVAREFGIPTVYDSWVGLVSALDSDAIVIGTWPYMHYPVSIAALSVGKHVMCEARMAMNGWEAKLMLQEANQHPELVTQVVPSPLTLHVDCTVKRLIGEGYLGRILAIEVRATSGAYLDEDAPLHWRQDSDLSGLNVMSLGIWYEAMLRWVGGAKSVMAQGQTFVKMRRRNDGTMAAVSVPDHIDVLAQMACGAQGHFQVSAVAQGMEGRGIYLCGSKATLQIAGDRLYGAKHGEPELQEIEIKPKDEGAWRVEEEFVGAIRGEETVKLTSFADGVKYMAFTQAVAESMATGGQVAVTTG